METALSAPTATPAGQGTAQGDIVQSGIGLPAKEVTFAACPICGGPVPRGNAKRPREAHFDCRRFRSYLEAARKHLEKIEFLETVAGRAAQKKTRGDLIAVSNKIPSDWIRPRDAKGKWLKRQRKTRGAK